MNRQSFTSANEFPVKVAKDVELIKSVTERKFILCRHLQICPTNKCNNNCSFCSCADRDKSQELNLDRARDALIAAKRYGCQAVTITGGGEPLLYAAIQTLVDYCQALGLKVGIVTNGILINNLPKNIKWCRISVDAGRALPPIHDAIRLYRHIDWAVSYVLSNDLTNLKEVVDLAPLLTHIRVVHNILAPSDELMAAAKALIGDNDKVILQDRATYTPGSHRCLISLLKPTLAANGLFYACCGIQYSKAGQPKDFTRDMGDNLNNIMRDQASFNGSSCDRCYYSSYNTFLAGILDDIDHKEWA